MRNSIILIDFIGNIYRNNPTITLADAIIEAGATRLNPIFLTAASAVLGSMMIVLDPIFSGVSLEFYFWHYCLDLILAGSDTGSLFFD